MKKSSLFIVLLFLGLSASYGHNNPKKEEVSKKLRNTVAQLLAEPNISLEEDMLTSTISFTINKKGEIVVLDVDTPNVKVENLIKSRLNYYQTHLISPENPRKLFTLVYKIKSI